MAVKQRARKDEDKAARRRAILDTAARMLGREQYHRITMAEVARRCHLAKGTLYLYFRSKEELFLAALEEQLAEWFDALVQQLPSLPAGTDPAERFARALSSSLAERKALTDLLPLVHTVLEHNIDEDTAMAFKQMLLDKITLGARALEQVVPGLPAGCGTRLLLRLYALLVGLQQVANPAPVVALVLERPEMAPLRIDFEQELAESLAAMIRGMLRVQAVPASG